MDHAPEQSDAEGGGVKTAELAEREFWKSLEFRVCREMKLITECRQRGLWCDGFLPEEYALDAVPGNISGMVWIDLGKRQEKWRFDLLLASLPAEMAEIPWSSLLPEEATCWLDVDSGRESIRIRIGATVPESPVT